MSMNFYCPDFYHGFGIYKALLSLKHHYPNVFRDDVNITHIFGVPYNSIWNGGGYSFNKMPKVEELEECAQFFYDEKVHLQLTFTNALLERTDCYDRYSNAILDIFNNEYNEILIASPVLEEYLRNKNLLYKFDRSIIAANKYDNEDYNKELEKYNRVVMSRCHSERQEWLESIDIDKRNRVEILVNEKCPADCPRLHTHYYHYAKKQLFEPIPSYELDKLSCTNVKKRLYSWECDPTVQHIYTYDEIKEKYSSLGYTEFKISGRGNFYDIIKSIVPYLIKEEYQIEVFYFLLKNGVPFEG